MPEDRRTRATLRSAEFGFLGVVVYTRVHTPRRCGEPLRAGVLDFPTFEVRPLRTSCWIEGTTSPCLLELYRDDPRWWSCWLLEPIARGTRSARHAAAVTYHRLDGPSPVDGRGAPPGPGSGMPGHSHRPVRRPPRGGAGDRSPVPSREGHHRGPDGAGTVYQVTCH